MGDSSEPPICVKTVPEGERKTAKLITTQERIIMYSQVISAAICGLRAHKVTVEADIRSGMPMFSMVGYLSSEVREAQDRVRTALRNTGLELPVSRITVNLAPADLRKEGAGYDLPIAMAVLAAAQIIDAGKLAGTLFAGELGLDGRIEPVRGVIEMVSRAEEFGCSRCIIPVSNLREGSMLKKGEVLGAGSLQEVVAYFQSGTPLKTESPDLDRIRREQEMRSDKDFSQIRGQAVLKRAAEVAVAGGHNLLIIGPPGAGKSMTAQRIPTILPRTGMEEALEITRIHSIAGTLPGDIGLMTQRPFRAPHHTISAAGLAGGGMSPRPGEISLAHRGILFCDELPEFNPDVLEILRQPLEDKQITISRVYGNYTFPADFQLIASANPCKCGYYPDRKRCKCTPWDIRRYLGRISRPLLDRIDMCVEAQELSYEEMTGRSQSDGKASRRRAGKSRQQKINSQEGNSQEPDGQIRGSQETDLSVETSAMIRERVERTRTIQRERFKGTGCLTNAGMGTAQIEHYCVLGEKEEKLMEQIYKKMNLTGRGYYKLLRVSRTLADMDGKERIGCEHLAEAVSYKMVDQNYWGGL